MLRISSSCVSPTERFDGTLHIRQTCLVLILFKFSISENYYNSGVPPDQYQKQLEYQLRKLTLGVSVGLVKGIEPKEGSFLNPYQHFVPSLGNISDLDGHRFKICEKEPPSMEKVRKKT